MENLFENEEVVVINKPAGMLVHDDGSDEKDTVVSWVRQTYPEVENVGEQVRVRTGELVSKPGVVHRLDRDTTGVLLIAKTQESFENLKKQFQEHTIDKKYHAFVYGILKDDDGVIDRPIGKNKNDFRQYSAQRGARGVLREAQTEFKVLKRDTKNGVTLVELSPVTGRTHQIRVHMKAVHHPVVADGLYAPKGEKILGFARQALHAWSISFKLLSEESVSVEAPYPKDFEEALLLLKE